MKRRPPYALYAGGAVAVVAAAGLAIAVVSRWSSPAPEAEPASPAGTAEAEPARTIHATLYYVSPDGLRLVGVEREVGYGRSTTEQARRIVEAQLEEPPAPLVSAVPPGTQLRALFVTPEGDAFVDLSREVAAEHPGGSLDELFTIYSIVNALGTNLPAIAGVQILVEGQEVETLAGHVDLRHPLETSRKWIEPDGAL